MGLDTSHGAWHGAYSAFTRWRHAVAEAAGYLVRKVDWGDRGMLPMDTVLIDWGHVPEGALYGKWAETPADPLLVLIAHSDCEGEILPAQAGPLADRLEELLPKLSGDYGGHIGDIKAKTLVFIAGLRAAVEANEPLDFH